MYWPLTTPCTHSRRSPGARHCRLMVTRGLALSCTAARATAWPAIRLYTNYALHRTRAAWGNRIEFRTGARGVGRVCQGRHSAGCLLSAPFSVLSRAWRTTTSGITLGGRERYSIRYWVALGGCISISDANVHFYKTLPRGLHTQPRPPPALVHHSYRWQGEVCVLIWPYRPSRRS